MGANPHGTENRLRDELKRAIIENADTSEPQKKSEKSHRASSLLICVATFFATWILLFQTLNISQSGSLPVEQPIVFYKITPDGQMPSEPIDSELHFIGCAHFKNKQNKMQTQVY